MRSSARLGLSALLVCLSVGCKEKKSAPPSAASPPDVVVQQVTVRDTPIEVELSGQMRGEEDVEIRARVAGFVQSIDYQEGSVVEQGDLLFSIDPKPFQVAVEHARAGVAEAKALHDRAVVEVNRLRPLVAQNAVSKQDLDNALAAEESSQASMAAAQAQLASAQLDLSYTRITSPITGIAGVRLVEVGEFVGSPEPTTLTIVSSIDPIRFDFNIAETDYLTYARTARLRGLTLLAAAPPLELVLADGSIHPYRGHMTIVGRGISTQTATLPLEASFPNPTRLLRPGQFGRVQLPIAMRHNSILVPQRAVQELQGTYSVFVIGPGNIAQVREIDVANRVDSSWVVSKGLERRDRVVVEGLQKVKAGAPVHPVAPPLASTAPDTAAKR